MKRIIFLFLTCGICGGITIPSFLISQTQFQRTIGGTGNDYASSIVQTTDGGFALAGSTYSFGAGDRDMYIIKLDESGTLQWTRTIGGTSGEGAAQIIQTTDGGYAAAGVTTSFGAGEPGDMFIVKLDYTGSLEWAKTMGGTEFDGAYSIRQTTDGGYIVSGGTESFGLGAPHDCFIVRLDPNGTVLWSTTVGGEGYDEVDKIVQTTDGGYAAAGATFSFGAGTWDMYIVKLDASGAFQWSKTVGGTDEDWAYSITQATDGGYVLAGYTHSFGVWNCYDCNDMYIVKLDSGGTLQWTTNIGGSGPDFAYSITQTTDGGYAVAGGCLSFGGPDWYIVKLNEMGTLEWSKNIRTGTNAYYAYSIVPTMDGYAVAGPRIGAAGGRDMSILKLDASGNTCAISGSPPSQSGTGGTVTSPNPTRTSPSPTVTSPSPIVGTGGTLSTVCVIGIQPISNEIPASYKLYQNYPNPFNANAKIKFQIAKLGKANLSVFDVLGREVEVLVNEELQPGTYEIQWDASSRPSGVYYYNLTAGNSTETKKMVLLR